MKRWLVVGLTLLVFLLTSCVENALPITVTPTAKPTATLPSRPTFMPTPTAVAASKPTVRKSTPVPPPTTTPTVTPTPRVVDELGLANSVTLEPPSALFNSVVGLADHERAMTRAFSQDVKRVEATGAPIYNIAVQVSLTSTKPQAAGRMQILYTNNTGFSQNELYLWLYPNAAVRSADPPLGFSALRVNNQRVEASLETNNAQLRIKLATPLLPLQKAIIELDFGLRLDIQAAQDYANWSAIDQVLALNYWYPQLAIFQSQIGGWDNHPYAVEGDVSNSQISFFNLWISAPATMTVVPNGRIVTTQLSADGQLATTRIATGPVRDLVVAVSPNYYQISQKVGETTVTAYILERDRAQAAKVLEYSANAIRIYSELLGVYPYAHYRVVEASLISWGGLEFPGFIYITTRYFGSVSLAAMEFALVHEAAHQWFYGVVGNDQFRHAWIDESLAQYVSILYFEKLYSKEIATTALNNHLQAAYQAGLMRGLDDVVNQPIDGFGRGGYVLMVYNKGGLFYQAYREQFGDAAFFGFVKNYYETNRYKYVWPSDVLVALKNAVPISQSSNVTELYRKWLLAKEGN